MSGRIGPALAIAGALLAGTSVHAAEIAVDASRIETFAGRPPGERVGELIWRGGLHLTSPDSRFGGLSGITFTSAGNRLAMVSDRGNFVSGRLVYDKAGQPIDFTDMTIAPIENSGGKELPSAFSRDAEAIETVNRDGRPAAVRVGFENLTRVADFDLADARPTGPARPVTIPRELSAIRTNQSLEAVCIAPPASPIAGSTLLITESAAASDGAHAAWLLGRNDKGPLSLSDMAGSNPTDCAFLPNGDLLVLERGISLFSFTMHLRLIPAGEVRPSNTMTGRVILSGSGSDIDNMEGVAVHQGPDGETRILLVSDDNFNDWERTLLLEFALPG
ncbi:MAG TPA: esterase-like activity of phytase family protein [Devosiaceae bacterium]